jgi:hypothetical protein
MQNCEENMDIKSVKKQNNLDGELQSYWVEINNSTETLSIPIDPDNRHYKEIMRQVKEEGLTIKDAD